MEVSPFCFLTFLRRGLSLLDANSESFPLLVAKMNWEENSESKLKYPCDTTFVQMETWSKRLIDSIIVNSSMAALLAKFRIDYSDVIVIPDITKKAQDATKKEFEALIAPFKDDDAPEGTAITSAELVALREKTNRHLRIRELLQQHSKESTFIAM